MELFKLCEFDYFIPIARVFFIILGEYENQIVIYIIIDRRANYYEGWILVSISFSFEIGIIV